MNERVVPPGRRLCRGLGCAVALAIALGSTTVAAQTPGASAANEFSGPSMGSGPGMGGHQRGGQGQANGQPHSPAPLPLPVLKAPWPRLDAGAILCKSREDLVAYQKRQAGAPASGPAPDCHIIQQLTPVQILDRQGLASTHVALTDASKQTGWTDVYIPATPPH
jgi:hypothetical protein